MEEPTGDVIEAAAHQADEIARKGAVLSCLAVLPGVAGVVMLVFVALPVPGLCGVVASLCFGALGGVLWRRSVRAASVVRSGPYQDVQVVGWFLRRDGCNYALFVDADVEHPDAVLEVSARNAVPNLRAKGHVWAAGRLVASSRDLVVLLDQSGLLATGRIVDHSTGTQRWERRHSGAGQRS